MTATDTGETLNIDLDTDTSEPVKPVSRKTPERDPSYPANPAPEPKPGGSFTSPPKAPLATIRAGAEIAPIIPSTFEDAQRIARMVVEAGLQPKGLDTQAQVTLVIMAGLEVGLPPIQALQSIALINGKPCLYGDGMLAVVRRSGLLEHSSETLKEGDGVNGLPEGEMVATCRLKRKYGGQTVRTFSVADAKVANLWGRRGRSGEPTPWVTHPKRMLMFRARGFALRDAFTDVLKGMGSAEEQLDIVPDKMIVPPPPPEPGSVIWTEHEERPATAED